MFAFLKNSSSVLSYASCGRWSVSNRKRALRLGALASVSALAAMLPAQAQAQNVVSVCTGVSLPRSAVTDTIAPVVDGIVAPTQTTVNGLLGALPGLPIVGGVVPPLAIDAAGLLADAAAGQPITLQVLDVNGNVISPTDACQTQSDSFSVTNPQGVSVGGNQITGLGDPGRAAVAGEIDSLAIGNDAATDPTALRSVALGTGATVQPGVTDSVALGSGSVATRGPTAGSAGEVSVGAPGAERQITNVAAGTAATDAANVGQVRDVAAGLAALDDRAVQYDTDAQGRVTLGGATGTTIGNLAPGAVTATSTEAVNGSQLFATNQTVAANTAGVARNAADIAGLQAGVANGSTGPVRYSDAATPAVPNGGVPSNNLTLVGAADAPVVLSNVAPGTLATGSTEAVNGGQLFATNTRVAQNSARVEEVATTAVRYDGPNQNAVTLRPGGAPVALRNLANGVAANDAATFGQLSTGLSTTLASARAYTDEQLAGVRFDLRGFREDAEAGTAGALAVAGLPQTLTPGKGMVALGVGTFQGESAFALGGSVASKEGDVVFKLSGTYNTRGDLGASAGIGFGF